MEKKLFRDEQHKTLGGVCAGLAEYFDMDIAIVRALFLLTFLFMGTGLMAYIILWIVLPKKDYDNFNPNVDYRVPPEQPYRAFDNRQSNPGNPFANLSSTKKQASTTGLVFGVILIFFGAAFLLHELHVFYFFHVAKLWPLTLILVGFAIMVSGQRKQPWDKPGFDNAVPKSQPGHADDVLNREETKDNDLKDTPPTI